MGALRSFWNRRRTRPIREFLGESKIGLVDVGASGGLEPRWDSIRENIRAFLFEPDQRSHQELKKSAYVDTVFPVGLSSSETTGILNMGRKPGTTSFLNTDRAFLSRFPDVERYDVVERVPVSLSTLDSCLKNRAEDCDFIKLDTQGTELDILHGAESLLEGPVIGLEVEVEFARLYTGRALFSNICSYLEKKNYEFLDFVNICRWERDGFTLFGQAAFGDIFFIRSPEAFAEQISHLSPDIARPKAKKYVAILALYDHIDLLPICLSSFEKFLDARESRQLQSLYRYLLFNRRLTTIILRVTNMLLIPFGTRVTPLQAA